MSKQNIYDNDVFFENFKNSRADKINFNDCIDPPFSCPCFRICVKKRCWILAAEWDSTQSSMPTWAQSPS